MLKYSLLERRNPITKKIAYYANLAPVNPLTLEAFSSNICNASRVSPLQLLNVIECLEKEITQALLNGHSVRLGDLGSFHLTISSDGANTVEEFSTEHLNGLRVQFIPCSKMRKRFDLNHPDVVLVKENGGND